MPGKLANTALFIEDFWQTIRWASDEVYVMACEKGGELIGFGSIVVYSMWLGGQIEKLAYLTQLRLKPKHRGGTALVRAYRFLNEVKKQVDAKYFFTSILDSNVQARRALVGGRAGLPDYLPLFSYRTYLLPLGKRSKVLECQPPKSDSRDLNLSHWEDVPDITTFGLENGAARLSLTTNPNKKATLIASYPPLLRTLRPFYNFTRPLHRGLYLPPPGEILPLHYATQFVCDTPAALLELISGLGNVVKGNYLALGLAASHPHSKVFKRRAKMTLDSTLYQVCWPDSRPLKAVSNPALSVALL